MAGTQTARSGTSQAPGFAVGRGLLLVLLAVAIGVLLLARAVDPGASSEVSTGSGTGATTATGGDAAGNGAPTATTDGPTPSVATIPPAKSPAEVTVIVANGRAVQGAAAANKEELLAKGFNALTPLDHPLVATTSVYFQDGYQADALNIAQALGIDVSAAVPMPETPLPVDTGDAMVVVVLGTDGQGLKPS
jgi:hypothetical protein